MHFQVFAMISLLMAMSLQSATPRCWGDYTPDPSPSDQALGDQARFRDPRLNFCYPDITPDQLEASKAKLARVDRPGTNLDPLVPFYRALQEKNWQALFGKQSKVKITLPVPAVIKYYSNDGMTFLHCAAAFADEPMARDILTYVDPRKIVLNYQYKDEPVSDRGITALMFAAQHGNSAMTKVLLQDYRSDANTTCFHGLNALMYAVQHYTPGTQPLEGAPHLRNYQRVIELLMQLTDLHAVDSGGRTVLDHALLKRNRSLVAQLRAAGVCT